MGLRALKGRLAALAIVTVFAVAVTAADAALVSVYSTQNSALGKILVSANGRTLYHNAFEKGTTIKCAGACAAEWPPLVIAAGAKPVAGTGVTAKLLGTIKRSDGKLQVTYGGKPLYLFSGDKKAGDVKGQGSGGIWHALTPSGAVVTKTVSTSSGKTSSGSGTSSSGSGSTGSGSSGSSGNTGGSGGTTTPNDCLTNPGGYGCM
jgi:predicted lipoprotein with Yx(FWY)xxD motif